MSSPTQPRLDLLYSQLTPSILTSQVLTKWQKPIVQTPLSVDFPRLFSRTTILEDGTTLMPAYMTLDPSARLSKERSMKDFLILIANKLEEDELVTKLDQNFFSLLPDEASTRGVPLGPCISDIFQNVIGEESGVTGIMKCLSQAVVLPAVMALRVLFIKEKINYKDCRGQWDVDIEFKDNKVLVTHKKWEETIPTSFEFCWHMCIELEGNGRRLAGCTLTINTIKFLQPHTEDKKMHLFNILKDFYDPSRDIVK
eukprot:TRINITY_DN3635_c0_g1_i3.p1 TRINITY_DN3635_c0_g1~~TRINITY_DN3635_c0_g1_i3.p1  ORF type:complete len:255 (-),score=8.72 TRINITY_DN3635_c0_g1_i3:24-788(-)